MLGLGKPRGLSQLTQEHRRCSVLVWGLGLWPCAVPKMLLGSVCGQGLPGHSLPMLSLETDRPMPHMAQLPGTTTAPSRRRPLSHCEAKQR